jgi:hypothetical protein
MANKAVNADAFFARCAQETAQAQMFSAGQRLPGNGRYEKSVIISGRNSKENLQLPFIITIFF